MSKMAEDAGGVSDVSDVDDDVRDDPSVQEMVSGVVGAMVVDDVDKVRKIWQGLPI